MPDYNIEISQLNPPPTPVKTEDFFPLVHSASMTTYRVNVQQIGSLITHSLYADTASYLTSYPPVISSSWASASLSSSYAYSSSWAYSASHALLADSASYYPPQQFLPSASWASTSLQSYYATRSADVDTFGVQYNFPFWKYVAPGQGNGDLSQTSPIVFYPYIGYTGLTTFDSASTNLVSTFPYSKRPDFQLWEYNEQANAVSPFQPNLGIQTHWPITSHTFAGTDQRGWYFSTASSDNPSLNYPTNTYFSGSAGGPSSGSFYTIPNAPGALASIFNGHWVRIVSFGGNPSDSTFTAGHSAMGEMDAFQDQIMKGLISIQLQTSPLKGGSNSWSQVDFWVHGGSTGGNLSAQVLHVHNYGQLIRSFRVSTHAGGGVDPVYSIDMLIDGLNASGSNGSLGDPTLWIWAQSWQGIRFLKYLNVDPWPFQNTGSNQLTNDGTQLIFPAAPGYYSNAPKTLDYYIQGKNVVIWPNANELTQSGLAVPSQASTQSLFVSGGINTNTAFYCNNNMGLTTVVNYGTSYLNFSGGILIGRNVTTHSVTPVAPTHPVTSSTPPRPVIVTPTIVNAYAIAFSKGTAGRTDDYYFLIGGIQVGVAPGWPGSSGAMAYGTPGGAYLVNAGACFPSFTNQYPINFLGPGTYHVILRNFQDTGVRSAFSIYVFKTPIFVATGQPAGTTIATLVYTTPGLGIQGGQSLGIDVTLS